MKGQEEKFKNFRVFHALLKLLPLVLPGLNALVYETVWHKHQEDWLI